MSDRYLFKAKRIDNGEWVEGLTSMWGKYYIIKPTNKNVAYSIDNNTVCQYTGLTDKNGKRIFEGDIVSFLDTHMTDNGYVESCCRGEVLWDNETLSFQVTGRWEAESYEVLDDCEVIGNIFDNPELLEAWK